MKLVSTHPSRNYEAIGEVEMSTEKDIKNAVAKARAAFPGWSGLSLERRCELVKSFVKIAEERVEDIARIIATETGRAIKSSRDNVNGGINYFKGYLELAEKALLPKTVLDDEKAIHKVYREPWGVIGVISPWNYPFMNIAWQCGQALIAGNTIVYKNSEEDPLFAKLIGELMAQSQIPEGVFNVLYGDGTVGAQLAKADVDMISFTGSTAVGQELTKVAAAKFIPILTELGGSSPEIVFEDADIEDIMACTYDRRFINAGQSCSALKRLIVHESKFDEVVKNLTQLLSTKKVGDALDEDTDIGPLVAKRQLDLLEEQVEDAIKKGAKVEIGGDKPKGLKGAYYLPTVLTNITKDMRVWKEEVFGPVLPIIPFSTEEEAIELANDTQYGLGAHVMTNDKDRFKRVASKLQSGMVSQNKISYFAPTNPFGGYKKSGMGRVHGEAGFEEVTQIKVISEEK